MFCTVCISLYIRKIEHKTTVCSAIYSWHLGIKYDCILFVRSSFELFEYLNNIIFWQNYCFCQLKMTGRLSDDHMDQLESFIGTGPKTFRLLYSSPETGVVYSRSTASATTKAPRWRLCTTPRAPSTGDTRVWPGKTLATGNKMTRRSCSSLCSQTRSCVVNFQAKKLQMVFITTAATVLCLEVAMTCCYLVTMWILSTASFRCPWLVVTWSPAKTTSTAGWSLLTSTTAPWKSWRPRSTASLVRIVINTT